MPLVTAALLAYVCGLLSGLAGLSAPPLAAAVAVIWLGATRARDRIALSTLLACGVAAGSASADSIARCERAVLRGAVTATLLDEGAPGAFVAAHADCGVRLRVAVREGSAVGGSTVLVRGRVSRSRGGLMVDRATIVQRRPPGPLRRLRDDVGRGIDARFGANAPLVRALLIADMSDIAPAV